MSVRHLYLARHAEPAEDGTLTERGEQQAALLGRRLARVPLTEVQHGPLPRAARTARLVAQQLDGEVPILQLEPAGDYVPHLPSPDEVDPAHRTSLAAFLAGVSHEDAARGAELAAQALDLLTGPTEGDEDIHQLVVTHAFTIGWLVRHACGAPPWRWLGFDSDHTGLTVIRYFPDRPPAVAMVNDASHLTARGPRP